MSAVLVISVAAFIAAGIFYAFSMYAAGVSWDHLVEAQRLLDRSIQIREDAQDLLDEMRRGQQ